MNHQNVKRLKLVCDGITNNVNFDKGKVNNMNRQTAEKLARETMIQAKATAYAIIKYPSTAHMGFRAIGYDVDCDYEVFDTYEELEKFVHGKGAINWLDFNTSLRDGEKVISAYAKDKIIIIL